MNNYLTIKLKQDTIDLIPTAREVFLRHHKDIDGINLTNNIIIKKALEYYIDG